MLLFTMESETESHLEEKATGPISTGGGAQMLNFCGKRDVPLDVEKLTEQYIERIDEIFAVINAKKSDSSGKIKVDKVTVKLGVQAGSTIGWFVEGRFDVALAFTVEFKVGD